MERQNDFKQQVLQLELDYLQLLCIEEVVASIAIMYEKRQTRWPVAAKAWQQNVQQLQRAVQEAEMVTELIPTSFADKFVPKGYPVETFHFIHNLKKDAKRYEALSMEFVQNRVVSVKKLLFFSRQIQTLKEEVEHFITIFPLERKRLFKPNEANYFIKALHQFYRYER